MRYENTPRPDIEYHPHIRELIERQEKRAEDRSRHREADKLAEDRDSVIKDAHRKILTEFWCAQCKEDFKGVAYLQIETDWTNPMQRIALYRMKCFQGHWCVRFVTDRNRDPYWFRSRAIRRMQGEHHDDTLQSFQSGFEMLYGRKNS